MYLLPFDFLKSLWIAAGSRPRNDGVKLGFNLRLSACICGFIRPFSATFAFSASLRFVFILKHESAKMATAISDASQV